MTSDGKAVIKAHPVGGGELPRLLGELRFEIRIQHLYPIPGGTAIQHQLVCSLLGDVAQDSGK